MKKYQKKVEEVKTKDLFQLVEVPTGSAVAIKTPEGKVIAQEYALVEVLNILKKLRNK